MWQCTSFAAKKPFAGSSSAVCQKGTLSTFNGAALCDIPAITLVKVHTSSSHMKLSASHAFRLNFQKMLNPQEIKTHFTQYLSYPLILLQPDLWRPLGEKILMSLADKSWVDTIVNEVAWHAVPPFTVQRIFISMKVCSVRNDSWAKNQNGCICVILCVASVKMLMDGTTIYLLMLTTRLLGV